MIQKEKPETKPMIVYGELPDFNSQINAVKKHWSGYSKSKSDHTASAMYQLMGCSRLQVPCRLKFTWFTKNERKDPDNVAFGKKFLMDSMVRLKIIPDDSRKYVLGFVDEFGVDSKRPRVEIERMG